MRITPARVVALTALIVPSLCAAAQAAPAMAATPDVSNCAPMYSVGHKSGGDETWSYVGSDDQLYFYGGNVSRTSLCFSPQTTSNGIIVGHIVDDDNGECLTLNAVGNASFAACSAQDVDWWLADTKGTNTNPYVNAVVNSEYGVCLYENTQEPALVASCSAEYTDQFEWFYWPVTE